MIVAVAPVGMVEMSGYQVVDVVSVRHHLVTAARPVLMQGIVPFTGVSGGAVGGVLGIHLQRVFLHVLFPR